MVKVSDMICDVLVECGIDHIFGIPGGETIKIYDALYDRQDKIRPILTRHEHGASCMADMYGRLTGKPAVLMGQGAFIGSSGAFGIMEAYASSSPMLVLTDTSDSMFPQQGRFQCGGGDYGSFDLLSILRSVSKYATLATTPKEAVQGVQLAIKHATSGRPGPACVLMRSASLEGDVDADRSPRIYGSSGYLSNVEPIAGDEDLKLVLERLSTSKHPVIIAGNGVRMARAYDELQQLAEHFSVPVATSYKGKSSFPEEHPLALGMMGRYGKKVTNQLVGEADFLLAVGCRLSPTDTSHEDPDIIDPKRQRIIQIDIEPRNAGWTFPIEMGLIGDAKAVLGRMVDLAGEMKVQGGQERVDRLAERKKKGDYFEVPKMHTEDSPILPQRLIKILQDTLDPSTIITLDAGDNRVWFSRYFLAQMPGTIFAPGGIAGMGWGPPAALTAKLIYPDRPAVCVTGDGGFMMSAHVLSTALQYGLPVVFVVMNNSELGMIRRIQKDRPIATSFRGDDFARIAEGYGCLGMCVEKPAEFAAALKSALNSGQPAVLDVVINREESAVQ